MGISSSLPELNVWKSTRDGLHSWTRFLAAVRASIEPTHPRFWHGSLRPVHNGLTTGEVGSGEQAFRLTLDLEHHKLVLEHQGEVETPVDLKESPSANQLAHQALASLTAKGLCGAPEDERWKSDDVPNYEPEHASAYLEALVRVKSHLDQLVERTGGEHSPVQFWAHHFDLSVERYFGRQIEYSEDGKSVSAPAQIGFGWSTGDETHPDAYLYANPWPFKDSLVDNSLPSPACWRTDPWKGSLLPYSATTDGQDQLIQDYLDAVWNHSKDSLQA